MAVALATALLAAACGTSASTASSAKQKTSGTAPAPVHPDVTLPSTGSPKPGGSVVYGVEGESDGWNPTSAR